MRFLLRDSERSPLAAEGRMLVVGVGLLVLIVAAAPMLRLFVEPFASGVSAALTEYLRPAVVRATYNTIETGVLSSALALVIGAAVALAFAVTDMRGKRIFAFLFAMSMLIAPQVMALAFKSLAGPASPLLGAIGLAPAPGTPNPMQGRGGIILVLGLHYAPLAMLMVLGGLRNIPREIVEAACVDGASPRRIVWTIILPLLGGHLAAAGLLVFVAAIGNFGIPALLGLPVNYLTLPTLIYRRMASFGPAAIGDAAALSLLLGLVAALASVFLARLLTGRAMTVEAVHRLEPFWRLGRLRLPAEMAGGLLLLIALIVPTLSLLVVALVPALGVPLTADTVTLQSFAEVLMRQSMTVSALGNSFLFAGAAALVIGVLACPVAYVLDKREGRLSAAMRFAIDLPFALPGVVVAIAMILLFLRPLPLIDVSLYGTAGIIVLAYLSRFLALGVKPVGSALRQIDPAIEEAGALDGARLRARLLQLILPSVVPAVTAGMLLVFLTAFNELTVSALLWGPNTRTLGVVLFSLDESGLAGEAAALGVSTIVLVLALMLVIERMRRHLPEDALPWAVPAAPLSSEASRVSKEALFTSPQRGEVARSAGEGVLSNVKV